MILYLTYWIPEKYFAETVSIFMLGQAFTNIITGPISTLILDNITWLGLSGWRWLFIFEGTPAVLLGIVALIIMLDRPAQAKFLSDTEKNWLIETLAEESERKAKRTPGNKWKVFKDKKVWHLSFSYLCYVITLYGLGLWMPQILKGLAQTLSNTSIGFISTLPYICGGAAMYLVAWHSDKVQERRLHVALPISSVYLLLGNNRPC